MRPETPAYLVAYPFLEQWHLRGSSKQRYRNWILDSGAFSAKNLGLELRVDDFIAAAKVELASADPPRWVFALDVIGDWKASLDNAYRMQEAGVDCVPTYHLGDPEHVLTTIARDWPHIALGGCAGVQPQARLRFARQVFARVWPKRIHGFAFCSQLFVDALPWYSVDSTAWFLQPIRYHRFEGHGDTYLPRAQAVSLRAEIEAYLRLEERARVRWAPQMAELGAAGEGPTLYLANPNGNGPAWEGLTGFERET